MGYAPVITTKGGLLVQLAKGCEGNGGVLVETHTDTLGGMVAEVKGNGRLRLTALGGMNPNNAETENCVVITRDGKRYEGCFQMNNPSIHVNGSYDQQDRTYDNMEVVLDEMVSPKRRQRRSASRLVISSALRREPASRSPVTSRAVSWMISLASASCLAMRDI